MLLIVFGNLVAGTRNQFHLLFAVQGLRTERARQWAGAQRLRRQPA